MKLKEQIEVIKKCFTGILVETEDDGNGNHRIIINKFLSLEPRQVERKTLIKTIKVPGWLACLDNGEEAVELYEGTDFWAALEEIASELAKFRVQQVRDKFFPCMIPSRRQEW